MGASDDHNRPSPSSVWPLRQIDEPELKEVLERHQQWAQTRTADRPPAGAPADLSCADLRGAEIRKSNLGQANLQQADCRGARLIELDMSGANLANADMRELTFWNWLIMAGSNLKGADFSGAHIKNARGLTCQLIRQATVDQDTELPDYLGSCGR